MQLRLQAGVNDTVYSITGMHSPLHVPVVVLAGPDEASGGLERLSGIVDTSAVAG